MANREHLEILKRGVEVWNEWRRENADVEPDLMHAYFFGTNLVSVNLSSTKLFGANLGEANLSKADLSGADLSGANLSGANLSHAYLVDANLGGAVLSEANLGGANLSRAFLIDAKLLGTNLYGANLSEAVLRGAFLWETIFASTDLSSARGLDTCVHQGPSTIDFRTIRKSWPLPLTFLRDCGLDGDYIDYLLILVEKAGEYHSCFISYSSIDREFAQKLYQSLQEKGVRCWFAPEDLKIGEKTRTAIDEAIRVQDKVLLILSKWSVNSQWVEQEVETALEKERDTNLPVLFPIRIDDKVMEEETGWPAFLKKTRHIGDFCRWKDHDAYQQAFDRLLRDLKAAVRELRPQEHSG